nr:serine-rich adhesin for platelets [Drosophila suzukii]
MKCTLLTTLLASLAVSSLAAPFDLGDLFPGFQPVEKQEVVKRQVQANPDAELKQISFHGLIGDLEDSLFQSALSLHQASAPGSEVEEVKPQSQAAIAEDEDHALAKRSDESTPATDAAISTDDGRKILLQTTRKVPNSEDGVPAHLIIDHVSVQPHNGGVLSLIPTFQVHHTKVISATIKEDSSSDSSDGKQTKISITKTSITSTAPIESVEEAVAIAGSLGTTEEASTKTDAVTTTKVTEKEETTTAKAAEKEETTTSKAAEKEEVEKSSTTILTIVGSSTTSTSTTSTTTTEEPIEKLKKDEEKLKEKVAEVEADPVILSARV